MKKILFFLTISCLFAPICFAKEKNVEIYDEPQKIAAIPLFKEGKEKHLLSSFKGQFTMLVFWSKNCRPCVGDLKEWSKFSKIASQEKNIKIIFISPQKEWDNYQENLDFMKNFGGFGLDSYLDKRSRLYRKLKVPATPFVVLINSKGEKVGTIRGSSQWHSKEVTDYIYTLVDNIETKS